MAQTTSLTTFGVLVVFITTMASACSPEGEMYAPKTIQDKVYFSHAVVVGRATMYYPTPAVSSGAYTVTINVDCVIKDVRNAVSQGQFNITEAGVIEGMCHSALFQIGRKYLVFLKADASLLLKPWESPLDGSRYNLDEAMKTCNVQPTGSQCPAASTDPCIADNNDFADHQRDSPAPEGDSDHDHGTGEHHDDHDHHTDEDTGLGHAHDDHHKGDGSYDHDHDHTDHHDEHGQEHHSDHAHHDDEDKDLGHSHDDHHEDDADFDHDHDHSDHHHDHDEGHEQHDDHEHDHDHDHEAGSMTGRCSHTRVSVLTILLLLLTALIMSH